MWERSIAIQSWWIYVHDAYIYIYIKITVQYAKHTREYEKSIDPDLGFIYPTSAIYNKCGIKVSPEHEWAPEEDRPVADVSVPRQFVSAAHPALGDTSLRGANGLRLTTAQLAPQPQPAPEPEPEPCLSLSSRVRWRTTPSWRCRSTRSHLRMAIREVRSAKQK